MDYKELVNKFTKNVPSHYLICSKLGSGKTTFFNYLNAELANNYEKYNIIPLFINASSITLEQGSFINYLLSVYSDKISDREKRENLDRKQLFKECLNNDKYKFLLIVDSTELLDENLDEDLMKELGVFNEFKSLSIIYSTSNIKQKDEYVFEDYECIDDFGILNEKQICNYLNNHGFNVNYINLDWYELLNTPFFLTKFTEIYKNIDVDFSVNVSVVKSKLIEDYLDELIMVNNPKKEGTEYNIRRKFLYIDIPELIFEKNSQRIILPAEYDKYINNLSALNVVKDKVDSYECEISHLIYFNFFTAKHIKNCFEKNDLSECIKLLNKRIFDDEILTFLGEQLELKNENRKDSELYKCIDYIRQHYIVDSYQVAICNILNVFVNTCSEQLSGFDLSYLDLTQCDFIGIKCKNTDFSYSTLKDTCLIPNIATNNAEHFAISEDGKYCLLAEDYKFGSEYCNINIRDTDSGELIHSFYLPNIYSVMEVDNEKYAVLYNNGIHNIIAMYKYENSICVFYTEIGKKQFEYKLIGTYENKLFYFENGVLFSIDINTKAITDYAEFPLNIYKKIRILNKQFNENNNGVVLYNDNENINLFFISFKNILNNRFDRAYEYSVDKFDENAKVYFSEYEPVIAVCSNTNYELYNYKSNSHVPDDLDDYINQSEIYCGNFILYLGREESNNNHEYIKFDNCQKYLYIYNEFCICKIKKSKEYTFFDLKSKKSQKLLNQSIDYYTCYWENIDYQNIAFYNNKLKCINNECKRLLFNIKSKKITVENNNIDYNLYNLSFYKETQLQNCFCEYNPYDDASISIYRKFKLEKFNLEKSDKIELNKIFNIEFADNAHFPNKSEKLCFIGIQYCLDFINGNIFKVPTEFQKKSLVPNCREDWIVESKVLFYKKNRIIIYDYIKETIIIELNLSKYNIHLYCTSQIFLKENQNRYELFVLNYKFIFDINGKLIKNERIVCELDSDYEIFYYDYLQPQLKSIMEDNIKADDKEIVNSIMNMCEHFLNQNYMIQYRRYVLDLIGIIRMFHSDVHLIHTCMKMLISYPLDFFIFYSDIGNMVYPNKEYLHPISAFFSSLIGYTSEYISMDKSCGNIMCIRDLMHKLIMYNPLYDLDIQNANFKGVLGLSDYAKRIIDMYSGMIE